MKLAPILTLTSLIIAVGGCAGAPPIHDYTLARAAILQAQKSGAASYAPGYWYKADEYYRKAKEQYAERQYDEAKGYFFKARRYAEQAETKARLKRSDTSEGFE
ncbi:MAG: DUF4398 domain-containing protein [Pseudobdellovibrionaceae bacterium]|nr:DUF4398 domain-containing protein [Bdellovibrionales bacterium]USN46433.1 MAG: DUF4398 domain-containing protein [Pseudobdellovibrionaceae bacterium]